MTSRQGNLLSKWKEWMKLIQETKCKTYCQRANPCSSDENSSKSKHETYCVQLVQIYKMYHGARDVLSGVVSSQSSDTVELSK